VTRPKIQQRSISKLHPHPRQHELFPDLPDLKLRELAEDMRVNGLHNPVEILPDGTIICGHNRVRAAKLLGWETIAVIVRADLAGHGGAAIEHRLITDNLTRRQLTRLQQARAYKALMELETRNWHKMPARSGGLPVNGKMDLRDYVGKLFGMTGRNLDRYLAVLRTPIEVQDAFDRGELGLTPAAKVAMLGQAERDEIAAAIRAGGNPKDVVEEYLGRAKPIAVDPSKEFTRLMESAFRALNILEGREAEIRRGPFCVWDINVLKRLVNLARRMIPRLQAEMAEDKRRGKQNAVFLDGLRRQP
jgi:ParB family chromosome partitioning protein